jgi:hypothetical protein
MHHSKGFIAQGKEKQCVLIEKVIVWLEAITETVV